MTESAQTAKAIKAELKKLFPSVKFSVRSDNFSMGNSVDISWKDGPSEKKVDSIVCKYQYGSFNGMEDIYEYTNTREDIPQAKYISCNRTISDEIKNLVKENTKKRFNITNQADEFERLGMWLDQFVWRQIHNLDFTSNESNWLTDNGYKSYFKALRS